MRKKGYSSPGNILDATELQGPLNYHYKDLKSATKNFSEENKLGEGGFGDVYKVKIEIGCFKYILHCLIAKMPNSWNLNPETPRIDHPSYDCLHIFLKAFFFHQLFHYPNLPCNGCCI